MSRERADINLAQAHAPPMCSTPHIIFCSVEGGMIRWVAALVGIDVHDTGECEQEVLFYINSRCCVVVNLVGSPVAHLDR